MPSQPNNQWESCVEEFRGRIPAAPVLPEDKIRELLVDVIVMEDSVKLARSVMEADLDDEEHEKAKDSLLDAQLQLAVTGAHAYKMAAIRALDVARGQRDLFAVQNCLDAWRHAEHMEEAVHAEMMMRAENRRRAQD